MPTDRRWPNLFLIGAQKSGTTTLATMLSHHPAVYMSAPKEPGFLAFGERGYPYHGGDGAPAPASRWVVDSESAYLALFCRAPTRARYLGDASTWYLAEPGTAERIRAVCDDPRILVILRQPAERAYSAWCHARREGEEPLPDFGAALAAEASRDRHSHLLRYRQMGCYATQLKRYLRVFGREQLLVMRYEDLRDEPAALWARCTDFLGLNADGEPPASHRQNRSGQPRSRLLHRLLKNERFKAAAKRCLPWSLTSWSKARLDELNLRRFPPLPAREREALTAYFRPEIDELEQLTGLSLDDWKR